MKDAEESVASEQSTERNREDDVVKHKDLQVSFKIGADEVDHDQPKSTSLSPTPLKVSKRKSEVTFNNSDRRNSFIDGLRNQLGGENSLSPGKSITRKLSLDARSCSSNKYAIEYYIAKASFHFGVDENTQTFKRNNRGQTTLDQEQLE